MNDAIFGNLDIYALVFGITLPVQVWIAGFMIGYLIKVFKIGFKWGSK
jgi:hypothetical protein